MARKLIYFQKRAAKLGPSYFSCNERQTSCTRRTAKPRLGCPDCEFTIQRKIFVSELERELNTMPKGTRAGQKKWPSKYLIGVVSEIASLSYSTKGIGRNWTVVTELLVSVYRDEVAKMKAIESANLAQQSNEPDDSKDEGDFD